MSVKDDAKQTVIQAIGTMMDLGVAGNACAFADLGLWAESELGGPIMGGIYNDAGLDYTAKLLKGDWGISGLTSPVGITHMAFGTGGGTPGDESTTGTQLNNEVCRKQCYKRSFMVETNGIGDWVINGKHYLETVEEENLVGYFFMLEGAEGSFSGINEVGLFAEVVFNTASIKTAIPETGNIGDYEFVTGAVFNGLSNAVYTLSVVSGGFPGVDTGSVTVEYESNFSDSGQIAVSGFGHEFAIGTYGITGRFTQASGGDDQLILDDTWVIYCTANKGNTDYAAYGVWGISNTNGEVHSGGYLHKTRYLDAEINKTQHENRRFVELVNLVR